MFCDSVTAIKIEKIEGILCQAAREWPQKHLLIEYPCVQDRGTQNDFFCAHENIPSTTIRDH